MKPKKSTTIFKSMALLLMLLIGGWFGQPAAAQGPIRVGCNTGLLIDAIDEANAHTGLDVIELAPNCTYQMRNHNRTDTFNALPVIIEPLRIEGQGATLLGKEGFGPRHFHAKAPLSLVNLSLVNGASTTVGGAIYAEAELNLVEITLNHNVAPNGGGVYAEAELSVVNSHFLDNDATVGEGGAVYGSGRLTIRETRFSRNRAGQRGGGVVLGNGFTATIIDSSFSSNTTETGAGGAIHTNSPMTILRAVFNDNQAGTDGGGIYTEAQVTTNMVTFQGNRAGRFGGGLYGGDTVSLERTTFDHNRAVETGSGLYLAQDGGGISALINSVWTDNYEKIDRPRHSTLCLLCDPASKGRVIVNHNTLANAAPFRESAIFVGRGQVRVTNSIITNYDTGIRTNNIDTVTTDNNLYFGNDTDESSSIPPVQSHLLDQDPRFVDPASGNYTLQADSPAIGRAEVDFIELLDRHGVHRPQGNGSDIGAYEFDEGFIPASHVISLSACNQGQGDVGELVDALKRANAIVGAHRLELAANCVYSLTTVGDLYRGSDPTGLPVITEYLVIAGNGATVERRGSAGDFRLLAVVEATLMLHDLTLQNGRSSSEGGGIVVDTSFDPGEELVLTNVTLRNNASTDNDGGGIYVEDSRVTIRRSTFENNRAKNGGGIYAGSTPGLHLNETTFRNNTARLVGGAIDSDDPVEIKDSHFENNRALEEKGGGVHAGFSLKITGSTFSDNSAPAGGAIHVDGGATIALNNTFVRNAASVGAGLLFEVGTTGNQIVNNLWVDNRTTNTDASAVITLQPPRNGQPGRVDLIHNTIASPTLAEGSGIYVEGVTATLRNNIISNYRAAVTTIIANGTQVRAEHNLTFTEETTKIGKVDEQNNRIDDPLFIDPANGNYRLRAGSPAIDAGLDAGITVDLDGATRPIGNGFDIGAFEFGATAPNPGGKFTVFLPLVVK